jgi:hypothetical protein
MHYRQPFGLLDYAVLILAVQIYSGYAYMTYT